jgi:predicted  nucleic acid-binding Zn-ribbon protein
MLDNIKLATKSEIQKEIENLEFQFSQKNNELRESFDKWKEYVQNIDKEMRELSVYYNTLKKEIDKREGKNK